MIATLAHPSAEDLGSFIEGTLDESARASIVAHIADCDDCRIIVVDTTEFRESSAAAPAFSATRWWAIAAAVVLVVAAAAFVWNSRRDPLVPVIQASAHLSSRSVEARLSGFQHVARMRLRGAEQGESSLPQLQLESEVEQVLARPGNDPKTLHARGIALLVKEKPDLGAAVEALQAAAKAAPANASYQSDLAAALIARGDLPSLKLAIDICDRALQVDQRSAEASFNRAKALDLSGRVPEAFAAYERYLAIDSSTGWAAEARERAGMLKQELGPR